MQYHVLSSGCHCTTDRSVMTTYGLKRPKWRTANLHKVWKITREKRKMKKERKTGESDRLSFFKRNIHFLLFF
jgi:hypothetical protein